MSGTDPVVPSIAPAKSPGTDFHLHRGVSGCLCCGSPRLVSETTLTSGYLSRKAWNGPPELTKIHRCEDCGFRFHDRGLSEKEAASFYDGYRSEQYRKERSSYEPFYTRRAHDEVDLFLSSKARRDQLRAILSRDGAPEVLGDVLDWGGGSGIYVSELAAKSLATFDISGTPPVPGVRAIDAESAGLPAAWDVVVCAQVLEHVTEPLGLATHLLTLLRPGGLLYLEVPIEPWRSLVFPGRARDAVLRFAARHRLVTTLLDVYSTAIRIKTGILPPFGFIPVREHLNYFSPAALRALATRAGGVVSSAGVEPLGGVVAVVRKKG